MYVHSVIPYPCRTVSTPILSLTVISIFLLNGAAPQITECSELKSYSEIIDDFARKTMIGGTRNALVILWVFIKREREKISFCNVFQLQSMQIAILVTWTVFKKPSTVKRGRRTNRARCVSIVVMKTHTPNAWYMGSCPNVTRSPLGGISVFCGRVLKLVRWNRLHIFLKLIYRFQILTDIEDWPKQNWTVSIERLSASRLSPKSTKSR